MDVSLLDEVLTQIDRAAGHAQDLNKSSTSCRGRGRGRGQRRSYNARYTHSRLTFSNLLTLCTELVITGSEIKDMKLMIVPTVKVMQAP